MENLIAASAVADPLPSATILTDDDPRSLADYSLYVGIEPLAVVGPMTFATNRPINATPVQALIQDSHLILSYKLSRIARPIIVGHEQGRCYLLTDYGRVIAALGAGVKRLLCLVYFGLDLTQRDMRIRGLDATSLVTKGDPLNHFGRMRLTSERPPLVTDFLNEELTVKMPSRAAVFVFQPSVQIIGFQLEGRPKEGLPLEGGVGDQSAYGPAQRLESIPNNEVPEVPQA